MRASLNCLRLNRACVVLAGLFSVITAAPAAPAANAARVPSSAYDVAVQNPPLKPGAQPVYQADNPTGNLRLVFEEKGVLGLPRNAGGAAGRSRLDGDRDQVVP